MTRNQLIPTLIAFAAGLAGLLIVLYAWHLPPFQSSNPQTENAYIRGTVTSLAPQLSGYVAAVEVQDFQPVTQGQVIARIDDRQYRQKLANSPKACTSCSGAICTIKRALLPQSSKPRLNIASRAKAPHCPVQAARKAGTASSHKPIVNAAIKPAAARKNFPHPRKGM